MRLFGIAFLLCALFAVPLVCDSEPDLPRELSRAVSFVHYLASPRYLQFSAFPILPEESGPSAFVAFLFSDLGVPEWVSTGDPLETEQGRAAGIPWLPPGVALQPREVDPGLGQQVVLRGDDRAGTLVVEASQDPRQGPIRVEELPFPPR